MRKFSHDRRCENWKAAHTRKNIDIFRFGLLIELADALYKIRPICQVHVIHPVCKTRLHHTIWIIPVDLEWTHGIHHDIWVDLPDLGFDICIPIKEHWHLLCTGGQAFAEFFRLLYGPPCDE